jgi:hypothetical protein
MILGLLHKLIYFCHCECLPLGDLEDIRPVRRSFSVGGSNPLLVDRHVVRLGGLAMTVMGYVRILLKLYRFNHCLEFWLEGCA